MKTIIKKLLREGLISENSNYPILPYYDGAQFDEFGLDEYQVYEQAEEVAKMGGVTILNSKHLNSVMFDSSYGKVIGGLWVSQDSDEYSFDIAIDTSYQGMGLATPLLDVAMSEYSDQRDVYGDELDIVIDVINPKLAQILKKKYGFEVTAELSQNRVLMTLNESTESYDGFEFDEDYHNYNNHQDYIRCKMYDGDTETLLAHAEYVRYQDKIYIDNIEAHVKGKGYGTTLMKHIAKLYGYENMERSSLTPDGVKMRQRLDKHFNYEPKEINNHIPLEDITNIRNKTIKAFLFDLVKNGYEGAWERLLNNPSRIETEKLLGQLDMDFNDVSTIADYVQGSKSNDNDPEEEPPFVVVDELKKIKQL